MVMIMAIIIRTSKKVMGLNKKLPWARMGIILWVDKELV